MQTCIIVQIADRDDPLTSIASAQKDICHYLGVTTCAKDQNPGHSARTSHELLSRHLAWLADPFALEDLPDGQNDNLHIEPE